MNRQDLERVAARSAHLRGLSVVPLGLFLLYLLALGAAPPQASGQSFAWLLAIPVVGLLIAERVISRRYDRSFGRVRRRIRIRDVAASVGLVVSLVAGNVLELRMHELGPRLLEHMSAVAALFGLSMLAQYRLRLGALEPHHVAIWGSLAVLGTLPVWGHGPPLDAEVVRRQAYVILAAALVLNGALDHLLLRRSLPAPLTTETGVDSG